MFLQYLIYEKYIFSIVNNNLKVNLYEHKFDYNTLFYTLTKLKETKKQYGILKNANKLLPMNIWIVF